MVLSVVLVGVVAVAAAVLVTGHGLERPLLVRAAKPVASVAFVVLAASRWTTSDALASSILVGLVLGAIGDLLLLGERTFDLGLAAFLLGHLAYIRAFGLALPLQRWSLPALAPPLVVALAASWWLWARLGRRRLPVLLYIAAITVMVWGALSGVLATTLPLRAGLAAVCFFASDLTVARERFVSSAFVNRAIGLPLYYTGQVLFALTIGA